MFELGREGTFRAGGKTYRTSRLERRIIEQFFDFIRAQEGDPFAEIKELLSPHLDPAQAKEMIEEAKLVKQQLQTRTLACPLADKYLHTELGQAELLYLLLLDRHPDITREEAFRLWSEMGAGEMAEKINEAQGQPPPAKNDSPPAA